MYRTRCFRKSPVERFPNTLTDIMLDCTVATDKVGAGKFIAVQCELNGLYGNTRVLSVRTRAHRRTHSTVEIGRFNAMCFPKGWAARLITYQLRVI